MNLKDYILKNQIILELKSKNKEDAIVEMANAFDSEFVTDKNLYVLDVLEREKVSHTALDNIVATPHAKSKGVKKASIVIAKSSTGIDFSNGEEEKSKLFFMIAVPYENGNLHLDIISSIANIILDTKKVSKILDSNSYEEIIDIIEEKKGVEKMGNEKDFIVAVTACPTGIAHTFMAKNALEKAASEMGVEIKVETNGTDGRKNEITKEDLKRAKGVILAINKSVDEDRFNGYKVIKVSAKDGINKAHELISDILDGKAKVANYEANKTNMTSNTEKKGVYAHLMSGVTYMLPLVISGGILIALAFLADSLAGNSNVGSAYGSTSEIAKALLNIGKAAFGLFVPILGGFIAYSIGNKLALTAGLVAGSMAASGGSGFLGAIIGGLVAGYIAKKYSELTDNAPRSIKGINLILITPVLTVLITGLLMTFILNPLVGQINLGLTNFLNNMSTGSRVLLGILLGGMMAVDMGGPVNKAAYVFGTGTLATTLQTGGSAAMAAVMAGGMVPPLAIALATSIFKSKYNKEEREAGISNYIMGISFITEGAIPFAAANPFRVIPACIIGSALAGALTMLFDIKIPAPHGGILVMFLSSNFFLYLLAIVVGSVVGAIILGILKERK